MDFLKRLTSISSAALRDGLKRQHEKTLRQGVWQYGDLGRSSVQRNAKAVGEVGRRRQPRIRQGAIHRINTARDGPCHELE